MANGNGEAESEVQELGLTAAKTGTIYLGGEIATSVVVLVLLIFLARVLQPTNFGLYSIAISFAGILNIAQTFGIGTAYRKMLPEIIKNKKARITQILSAGYAIALPLGIVIAIVGMLISGLIAKYIYSNPALMLALLIAAFSEFISVLFNLTQGVLVGLGKVKEATIANAVYSVMYLIGSVGLVLAGYGVVGAVSGMVIGLAAGSVVGVLYMFRTIGLGISKPKRKDIREVGTFSAPIVASYMATQSALNLAVLLLGVVAITSVVGNYGAAYKLARFVDLTITATTFILLGIFSSALSKKSIAKRIGSIYNKSIYYTALFLFPLVAYGMASATPLIRLLFSSSYSSAPLYFAIMIAGMTVGLIGSYAGTLIISSGNTKKFMKYQLAATAIQIILLFALAPFYKAIGALVALFVITPIVLDIMYIKALEGQFKFKHDFAPLIRIALVSAIIGVIMLGTTVALHQREITLIANGVIAIFLFPPLLALVNGVKRSNLDFIKRAGTRLRQFHYITDMLANYAMRFVRE